jgi:type I restriction enzyme R subunit
LSDRAKASEMEHAIRSHLRKHMDEDPVKYGKLSERLKELLEKLDSQWQEQVDAFEEITRELREDQAVQGEDLPDMPVHYLPFLRLLTQAKLGDAQPDTKTSGALAEATAEVVEIIIGELRIPDFWKPAHIPDQERLKGRLFEELFNRHVLPQDTLDATVDKLMELARANHHKLLKA